MAMESSSGGTPPPPPSSSSSSSADSYIGSVISLTSKSEIRYEGVLFNINAQESSIGLRNVRSFGTEGRKKDGPQVPPNDKVYEYILFRGSDIRDLQVKSSPPVQSTPVMPPINSDPAIIQSHHPRLDSISTGLLTAVSGSLPDINYHTAQLGHPGSTFQGGLPLYQPGGNLGPWAQPPPPNANGGGLAMPMYWQGYYGSPNGLPQLHQQSLPRPPPGLSMPPSMQQQPVQYSGFNASLSTGASSLPGSSLPEYSGFSVSLPTGVSSFPGSGLPEHPSPLVPIPTNSLNLTSTSLLPSTLPSMLPSAPPLALAYERLPSMMPMQAPISTSRATTLNAGLSSISPLSTSTPDVNAIVRPISTKNDAVPGPPLAYQTMSQPISSVVGTTSSLKAETPIPSLVTPGQLLHFRTPAVSLHQSSQIAHKDVEVVQVSPTTSSKQLTIVPVEAQPPILPTLPVSRAQKPNGAPFHTNYSYRGHGRGRGTGISRPTMNFTEEFDFIAMNEKFKKDEVWGHLGKSNQSQLHDREGDGKGSDEDYFEDEDDAELPKFDVKPVYNKDDFFDSISCTALDNDSNNGRTRFSEQLKIDTETFGEFSRYRGGRGGCGPGRGGRFRGSYYGRGYGYAGRGRGRGFYNRDS